MHDEEHGTSAAKRLGMARRILDARRKQGLSQRDLAERLAVPLGTIDRLEQGLLDPGDLLTPLSKALGQSVSWLLNGVGGEGDLVALELRLHDIERTTAALAREREELGRRAASLDERELAHSNDSALLEERAAELEQRRGALEERAAALAAREALISKLEDEQRAKAAELIQDATKLAAAREAVIAAQNELAAARRALEAKRVGTEIQAALQEQIAKYRDASARWSLDELRSLVRQNESAHPDRRDDWLTYMGQLEEFADSDGQLPFAFESLIEEVFAPLLESSERSLRLAPHESV